MQKATAFRDVKIISASTWFHIHMAAFSTWRYVDRVVEISHATPKQALKNVAAAKHNVF